MREDRFKEEFVNRLLTWFRCGYPHVIREHLARLGVDAVADGLQGVKPAEVGLTFAPLALKAINEELAGAAFASTCLNGGRVEELTVSQLSRLGQSVMRTGWWKENSRAVKRRYRQLQTVRIVMST